MTAPHELPAGLTYGSIFWNVIGLDVDAEDVDNLPDVVSINGAATITVNVDGNALLAQNLPKPLTILLRPLKLNIVNGRLSDNGGNTEIKLPASDCPALAQLNWTYTISYQLNDGYTFGSFPFILKTGENLDLTLVSPLASPSPGVVITKGEKGDPGESGSILTPDEIAALPELRTAFVAPTIISGAGIDATGATDSATAMQAKITAAGESALVWFPEGTFLTSVALEPLDGQTWAGPGVLTTAEDSTATALVQITGKTGVTIDIALDGGLTELLTGNSGASYTSTRHGVNITTGSTHCRVRGKVENCPGVAIRVMDSHHNEVTGAEVHNCDNGIFIASSGSDINPTGGSDYNAIENVTLRRINKNGIFLTGRTDSLPSPNPIRYTRISGVTVEKVGDTAIELGQGSYATALTNFSLDGTGGDETWVGAYNGLLIKDSTGHSVSGGTIRRFLSYTNGDGTFRTLGNGIYVWPQHTGVIRDLSIADVVIEDCTRGVFLQGNQHTATDNGGFYGMAGDGGIVYAGCTMTGVVVNGTNLGRLEGSWESVQTGIDAHGFLIHSVAGWTLTGCVAKRAQHDGFRIGGASFASGYVLDIDLIGCRAQDNGQAAVAGQGYAGFHLAGAASQGAVHLLGCRAVERQASGAKTQHNGFRWNSSGAQPTLVDCKGAGHSGTYANGVSGATTYSGVGSDTYGTLGGSIVWQTGAYTVPVEVSVVTWAGSTTATVTLPSASFSGAGRTIRVINAGTAAVTIAKSGGGTLSKTSLAVGEDHIFVTDGTNWY